MSSILILVAWPLSTGARGDEVFREDFDRAVSEILETPGAEGAVCSRAEPVPPGRNSACVDDIERVNGGNGTGRLLLTRFRGEVGHAWFRVSLPASGSRISAAFDLFVIAPGPSPTDGFSFVLQGAAAERKAGRPGASLGTGGMSGEYLSVAVDLRDDGDLDPEGPCDDSLSAMSCHLEVNRSTDPAHSPSLATSSDIPDLFGAGKAGIPIRFFVELNERELVVDLQTEFGAYGRRRPFHLLVDGIYLPELVMGFVASSGSSNVTYAVDNVVVSVGRLEPPEVVWEPARERGGRNCGGGRVVAEFQGEPVEFAADGVYGSPSSVEEGPPTRFELLGGGRIPTGYEREVRAPGPIRALSDPELEQVFGTAVSSPRGLEYVEHVVPGRYRVYLLWAIASSELPFGAPPGERRFDVELDSQPVLLFFSPSAAAQSDLGGCGHAYDTALIREFSLDVPSGLLKIRARDLGGGEIPGDALLSGYAFRRIGEVSGEPVSGQLEDSRRPAQKFEDEFRRILSLDFEEAQGTAVLAGLGTANGGRFFRPQVVGGRLRLADDSAVLTSTSVVFDGGGALVFDPQAIALKISLDVYISSPDGGIPGEGLVVGIVGTDDPTVLGAPGGSLGFGWIGAPGIGVEIDLCEGGGFGDDSGYDSDGQGHVAIVGSGAAYANVDHVQDMNDYDPSLDRETRGWIDWLSPAGVNLEILYTPEAHVTVFASANDGSFPRKEVLNSFVTPFSTDKAVLGLFAATGGNTATIELDNLVVEAANCIDSDEEALIAGPAELTLVLPLGGVVAAEFDGSGSKTGAEGSRWLSYAWSVSGPPGGADIAAPCRPTTEISFFEEGSYLVALEVDDGRCGRGPSARREVTVVVRSGTTFVRGDSNADARVDISDAIATLNVLFLGKGTLSCRDAADSNDDGRIDISDGIYCLGFLFLGRDSPPAPWPVCGDDPSEDALDCAEFPPCG